MFDIKAIRANPENFDSALQRRGHEPASAEIIGIDNELRSCSVRLQNLSSRCAMIEKEIAQAKIEDNDNHDRVRSLVTSLTELRSRVQEENEIEIELKKKLAFRMAVLPNSVLVDIPDGGGEEYNQEVTIVGCPPQFDFQPRQHFEIGKDLGMMDFDIAAKISGSRFVILKSDLARLERALTAYMLDLHTRENGYTEVSPPVLVHAHALFGTAELPKFEEELFSTTDKKYWLIPSGETPLTNLVRETVINVTDLPLRFTGHTSCFRREISTSNHDKLGMFRMHQFNKVELVSITTPETSLDELERMTRCACAVLEGLGLAYRIVCLSAGDTGFAAQKTYDIEVWLPSRKNYREISSCSMCGDFQARRIEARCQYADGRLAYVHTLNGSALAVGRTLIAILENYQQADGSVLIPTVLQPLMGGQCRITVPPS